MMKLSVITIMLLVSCSQQAVSEKQVKAKGDLNETFHHLKNDKNQEEKRSKYTEKNADKFQAYWDQIEKLVDDVAQMKKENTYLKQANMKMVEDFAAIKKENIHLKRANLNLVDDVAEMKKENIYINESYLELVGEVAEMKKEIFNNQSNVNEENFVSFTAYATEDKTYNEGDVVEFKGIINNYGNHYDNAAFMFTCPVSGYYMMSAAFRVPGGGYMSAEIMMDNSLLIGIYPQDTVTYDQASNLIVSLCNANQQIWVECSWGTNNQALAGTATTFTVTLLKIA